jgi:ClpP class serine protease
VSKDDFDKSKADVEEILVLFRDFVAENRPELDIENVATGETWFGTAALERKLCDEIKTVDDVLLEYVAGGYDVYEVEYSPPVESPFGKLLLGTVSTQTEDSSWLRSGVRWVVRTIASEVQAELSSSTGLQQSRPIEQRYMVQDDASSRIKSD